MASVRKPAVAGMFYPNDRGELEAAVTGYLGAVEASGPAPKAIIAPHAGFVYSGPVAASVYARLREAGERIRRVVLVGPSHRVPFAGLALPAAGSFATPLGEIPVDAAGVGQILDLPQVQILDEAHAQEHSLEVHLPFLQTVLGAFSLVPLVAGRASADDVAGALDRLWGGEETLIVVSSDLSHYHDYDTARRMDAATSNAIEALQVDGIDPDHACGCVAVAGLLSVARRRGLAAETIDLRNSGDTAGPRHEVVGYGAYAFA